MTAGTASPTLDGLFRRSVARQPDALALVDPIDKLRVCGQPPRRLTFAQADRAISALAGHFIDAGLSPGSVIAIQLPNTIECALAVLAAHRAGLVAALMPQLWRQADLTVALNRTSARAILTMGRIDGVSHADLAMNAAVEAFSIRHVCGFGDNLPDGMISLDQVIDDGVMPRTLPDPDPRQAALISFDIMADGMRAVPRTHLQVVAGGLALFLESGIPQAPRILAALAPGSVAGLTCSLVVAVVCGGTLALHHPYDADALAHQMVADDTTVLAAPANLLMMMAEAGRFRALPKLRHALGLWRAPERIASSPDWMEDGLSLTDVYLFGEAGLVGARRAGVAPLPLTIGAYRTPRRNPTGSMAGELLLTPRGSLALRGPAVPVAAYASTTSGELPLDCVDTGYAARVDQGTGTLQIAAAPAGVTGVGGYRFLSQDLQDWSRRLGQGALLTALPDDVSGFHLAGRAQDNVRAREALNELGLNPLMADAFRDRPMSS